jgi:hypothetical protein
MVNRKAAPAPWSQRKTRHDPPVLEEAIAAAQGLTDQVASQIEIAAQLMGLPEDEVRAQVQTAQAHKGPHTGPKMPVSVRDRRTQVVVVERRSRRALQR